MTVYKLRNTLTVTADSVASLDVQFDGILKAFWWSIRANLDANDESYSVECSFLSTNTINSNDSRGSISVAGESAAGAEAAGFAVSNVNSGLSGLDIMVSQGERIHMHGTLTGTGSVNATIYLYVEDRADPRLRRRR